MSECKAQSKWTEEEAKNLVYRLMNARETYTLILPSPKEGKRLIIKNQDIDTAYEIFKAIWIEGAKADNYPKEVVEEYDYDAFARLLLTGQATNAMIIKDTHIIYKEQPAKETETPEYRNRMDYIERMLAFTPIRSPVLGEGVIKEDI